MNELGKIDLDPVNILMTTGGVSSNPQNNEIELTEWAFVHLGTTLIYTIEEMHFSCDVYK